MEAITLLGGEARLRPAVCIRARFLAVVTGIRDNRPGWPMSSRKLTWPPTSTAVRAVWAPQSWALAVSLRLAYA